MLFKNIFDSEKDLILQLAHLGQMLALAGGVLFVTSWVGQVLGIAGGAFLAIWIPLMIPMEFAMGVLGLLIIYITTLFVIPIWLATLSFAATQDAWESQHFRQGYVMILGLAIRPVLMVMVFFAIFKLFEFAGVAVQLFVDLLVGMSSEGGFMGTLTSMVMVIPSIAATAIIAWQLVSRITALVTDMPEKILQGLNLGQETFGTLGDQDKARAIFAAWTKEQKMYSKGIIGKGDK